MIVGTTVQTISAMALPWVWGGRLVVAGLAPVAQDRPDDQPLDDEEDDGRDEEDDGVEVPDVRALLGHRDRRDRGSATIRSPAPLIRARTRSRATTTATSTVARIEAVGRALRVLDIQGPQRGRRGTLGRSASPSGAGSRSARGRTEVMIAGARERDVRRAARPRRRRASVRDGSCDDAAMRRRSVLARAGWVAGPLGRLARGRPVGRRPRPRPGRAAHAREPAARLDVGAAARRSRSGSRWLVVVGGPAGRRRPSRPTRCRAAGRSPSGWRCSRWRSP